MSDHDHDRVAELFLKVCDLDPDERDAALDEACGDDAALRAEIESMLRHDADRTTTLLRWSLSTTFPLGSATAEIPARIGPYRIVRKLGEGGMGIVFLVEQTQPLRRQAALKIIKLGMDTQAVIARFEGERQALARMNHPNVARVFDAGSTEQGRPYFVMEHVEGIPITDYCDRQCLSIRERLDLFREVCEGIQHAHQKGVIHRDIKPSNVLVQQEDGKATPKIIDFGIAKAIEQRLTEHSVFTELGQLIGTPEYMSPEQAEITADDIDTRTDVYSLGVLLYELLVGALPFDARELRRGGFDEIRRRIREEDSPKPSTRLDSLGEASMTSAERRRSDKKSLVRLLRGDLDWISMKALEKDRTRRYGSPSELAADIRRHLDHQPVTAGPPGLGYRTRKFVRRHRVGVTAGTLIALALVLGASAATLGMVRAVRSEREAREQLERANREAETATRVSDFLIVLFEEADPDVTDGEALSVREVLDRGVAQLADGLDDQPVVRARLLSTIGAVYVSLGLYDEARAPLEEALAIQLEVLGEEHLDTADTLVRLGRLYDQVGDGKTEVEYLERALTVREKLLGVDDPEVAVPLTIMADNFPSRQREIRERALAIVEKHFGPAHPSTIAARSDLALTLDREGERARAREMHRLNIDLAEASGTDPPEVMLSLINLAGILLDEGRAEEALPLAERAVAVTEKVYEQPHPYFSAIALQTLGQSHLGVGEPEKARSLLERSLEVTEAGFGSRHRQSAFYRWRLARFFITVGESAKAEPLLRESLDFWEETLGEAELAFRYAEYHALHGETRVALDQLERAVSLGLPLDYRNALPGDPALESLRGDPTFDAIVARLSD